MSDPIWREDAINALYHHFPSMTMRECAMVLHEVPPAQPTLYGYQIEHLALIARVMEKEGITPEKAVETFGDISRIVQIIVEEQRKIIRKAVEEWGT